MIDAKLVEAVSAPDESERRFAAQEIGESGDPDAARLLIVRLRAERSRAVKEAILRSLSRIWNSSPVELIIELLKDDDPFVRAEAAEMLQRRAGDAMEGLNQLMRGGDRDLRKFSIDILSQTAVGVPDAIYYAALQDEDINVVISAIENIGSGRRTAFAAAVLAITLESGHPMATCAGLETLALIGTRQNLDALRKRFPEGASIAGMYLQPFLKMLGGTAGPEGIDEICRIAEAKGAMVHEVAIDALTKIASRHRVTQLSPYAEGVLCEMLSPALERGLRFHLVRLLGHFAETDTVALRLLPYIHDPDRLLGVAVVESLTGSSHPAVETALRSLLAEERDPEILEELEELLRRRPDGAHR